MAESFSISLLFLNLVLHFFLVSCENPLAPALYVFGDSLIDSGNNNFLQTSSKVNYQPYGIDFPGGPSGRFTNGNTAADFIAQYLGLPFAPPILGLSNDQKRKVLTGVNYGSGSAGILPESGRATGVNLNMGKQIKLFRKTVRIHLPRSFKNPTELQEYLSKSIYVISVGSNDYINNYLQPNSYNSSRIFTPEQFGSYLVHKLKQKLTKIYRLGARKLLVFEIGPIGCIPAIVNTVKPSTTCAENINKMVTYYNSELRGMLQELSSTLPFLNIVHGEIYAPSYDANQNPSKYGLNNAKIPCCNVSSGGLCIQDQTPCGDRTERLYWDSFHPMQEGNRETAIGCFNGSLPCTPINIQELVLI